MISVKHLTKYYGEHLAVNDISFEITEGHVYGFLGPNGAGKSTTMNIITGKFLYALCSVHSPFHFFFPPAPLSHKSVHFPDSGESLPR